MVEALDIWVKGIVQGVGFRPFVYRLARRYLINGWVLNAVDGVHIHAEGESQHLDEFVLELSENAPAAAQVTEIELHEVPLEPFDSFEIRFSDDETAAESTLVSPDLALCADCERELFSPSDRRFRYPFINCTNCGPRFTITGALPYDRANTSMAAFPMCSACRAEYEDPADRRFHAQPDACFECGPHLTWRAPGDGAPAVARTREESDGLLARAAQLLAAGGILAVKGLGGYHLACDARNPEAVARLRQRKGRDGKAFALMMRTAADARQLCHVSPEEEAILTGMERPIVLLRRRPDAPAPLPSDVAGPLPELGIMLPYTPVQHLLLHDFAALLTDMPNAGANGTANAGDAAAGELPAPAGEPPAPALVMTSGNVHDEPIITDDETAFRELAHVADAFLGNDREILTRFDDSVLRVLDFGPEAGQAVQFIRRARGYAPAPLQLPVLNAQKACAKGTSQIAPVAEDVQKGRPKLHIGKDDAPCAKGTSQIAHRESGPELEDDSYVQFGTSLLHMEEDDTHEKTDLTCNSQAASQCASSDPTDVQKGRPKLHIGKENEHEETVPMCNLERPFCTSHNPSPTCNSEHPSCPSAAENGAFREPSRTPDEGRPYAQSANGLRAADAPRESDAHPEPVIFATGPEQKNTFTFLRDGQAFVSQHLGDVENAATFDAWLQTKGRYQELFGLEPTALATDLHPEYLTTKWALEQAALTGKPLTRVQHHHAHIVAAMAENDQRGPVCGIAFDGTGYGADGNLWGGEVLLSNLHAYERFANFAYVPMPGGAAAIRHPLRMAYGVLWEADLLEHPGAARALAELGPEQAELCGQMIERGLNTPVTSSVGRLFDAASALLGVCTEPTYEGEAAILLEATLDVLEASPDVPEVSPDVQKGRPKLHIGKENAPCAKGTSQIAHRERGPELEDDPYVQFGTSLLHMEEGDTCEKTDPMGNSERPFCTSGHAPSTPADAPDERYAVGVIKNTATEGDTAQTTSVVLLDAAPTFTALLDDLAAGVPVPVIARRFHDAMVGAIVTAAQLARALYDITDVALSGGVFMNRYLTEHAVPQLAAEGFTVILNRELPPNDACVSLGQAIAALP